MAHACRSEARPKGSHPVEVPRMKPVLEAVYKVYVDSGKRSVVTHVKASLAGD